jgi:hypothetical protein
MTAASGVREALYGLEETCLYPIAVSQHVRQGNFDSSDDIGSETRQYVASITFSGFLVDSMQSSMRDADMRIKLRQRLPARTHKRMH